MKLISTISIILLGLSTSFAQVAPDVRSPAGPIIVDEVKTQSGVAVVPVGVIQMYIATNPPSGWFVCDGSAVSRITYSNLFNLVGTSYGVGDGSTTYNLPDIRGRSPLGMGAGAGLTARSLGEKTGTETSALVSNNIPAHVHNVNPPSTASGTESLDHFHAADPPATASGTESATHTHNYNMLYNYVGGDGFSDPGSRTWDTLTSTTENQTHTHTTDISSFNTGGKSATHTHTSDITAFNSSSSGAGTAVNNMAPVVVVNYIIKY